MAKPHALDGKRIKLISIDDKYTDLKPGDMGTVDHVDDLGQIHMKWDKGNTLALIPEIDKYEVIEESRKVKYSGKLLMFESFNLNNAMDVLNDGVAIIRSLVNQSSLIKMKYEHEKEFYTATLDVYFEDGRNTQGVVYEIDLGENTVLTSKYVTSDNAQDYSQNDDDPLESHYQSVSEIVEYLHTDVQKFIKVEESKKFGKGKRV